MANYGWLDVNVSSSSTYDDHLSEIRRREIEYRAYANRTTYDNPMTQEYTVRVGNANIRVPYHVAHGGGDITVKQSVMPDMACKEFSSNEPMDCTNPYESDAKKDSKEKEKTRRDLCSVHLFGKKN